MQVADMTQDCWTGTLSQWTVVELLRWCHEGKRTAMVRVGKGLNCCVVFFREGNLYRCEWGSLRGDDAVMALMELDEASFYVIQRPFPEPPRNVGLPTEVLLAGEERALSA